MTHKTMVAQDVDAHVQSFEQWERAEIARSASEARHTAAERLRPDERQVTRYMTPPVNSAFPLEYSFALLGDLHGRTVVDLGCGSGENSFLLARRGATVIGVDISPSLLELARQRMIVNGRADLPVQFLEASAHKLPIPDESVDVVLGIAILHHLDLALTSEEVARVLRPGGRAIFQEPVRDSMLIKRLRKCIPYEAPDISPFERPLTSEELRRFSAPFRVTNLRSFVLPFVSVVQMTPAHRCTEVAYRLDKWLLAQFPLLERYSAVKVIELKKL